MRYFYNKDDGFVHVNGDTPNDELPPTAEYIELPEYYVNFLMDRQGKYCTISHRDNGLPYLEFDDPEIHLSAIRNQAYDNARRIRNIKLSASDWTQIPDIEVDRREAFKEYRQKLRDISKQEGFPHTIEWPEEPS